jgi:hypothetical protein
MVVNYPRPQPAAKAPEWTLDHALEVSGVDPVTTQNIKDTNGDVKQNRTLFTALQVEQRMKELPPTTGGTGTGDDEPSKGGKFW